MKLEGSLPRSQNPGTDVNSGALSRNRQRFSRSVCAYVHGGTHDTFLVHGAEYILRS
jgi:hypothetical protein